MKENSISLLNGNTLELHFWFEDETHSMNAFIHNKCEYELLGVLKEIAFPFNADITIETEPLANGGIKRWFKILSNKENQSTITIALIVTLTTAILATPITTSISKVIEILIEKKFEDKEIKELEKEKLRLEIEKLKRDNQRINLLINENNVIKKKRSNFYETLENYPKVKQISFLVENDSKNQIFEESIVCRKNFKDFILVSNDLEPIEVENAVIEIISPVLKKGKYKWMGIYEGNPIPFSMKSNEFKTLVQTGDIQFKNGTAINCFLVIRKKIDNEGIENLVGYDVIRVNHYFENDNPIETYEGKHHRQKKEAESNQLGLFDNDPIDDNEQSIL